MGVSAAPLWPRPSPAPPSDEGPWKLPDRGKRDKMRGKLDLGRT